MKQETIDRLRNIPHTRCAVCESRQSYTNPMARCFECKNKFCYEHIWSGLVNKTMKKTDEARKICDSCREKHGYRDL